MNLVYRLSTAAYFFAVRCASVANKKARKMIAGRRHWQTSLTQQIDTKCRYIWVHCASLGEFEQGRSLIEKLKNEFLTQHNDYKLLVTFFSPSGYEIRKNYAAADVVCYLPFDTPKNARRFVEIVNPACAIFVKYEIWHYFIKELSINKIPLYLISATFRRGQIFFKKIGKSYLQTLRLFTHIFLQDESSQMLLQRFGFNDLSVCGDTRTDRVMSIANETYANAVIEAFGNGKTVVVAGSTWPRDEELLCQFINLSNDSFRFVIAPHEIHETHLKLIAKLLTVNTIRLSQLSSPDESRNYKVIIVDSIGILSKLYRFAHIAYIGGGFGAGIHNTLEAAVYNIPVIFGPKYNKFHEAIELIQLKAAFSINNEHDIALIINELTTNLEQYKQIQTAIKSYFDKSKGATDKIFKKITKQL